MGTTQRGASPDPRARPRLFVPILVFVLLFLFLRCCCCLFSSTFCSSVLSSSLLLFLLLSRAFPRAGVGRQLRPRVCGPQRSSLSLHLHLQLHSCFSLDFF